MGSMKRSEVEKAIGEGVIMRMEGVRGIRPFNRSSDK
jgi:hypothetical protein